MTAEPPGAKPLPHQCREVEIKRTPDKLLTKKPFKKLLQ
jgi:hypothetical protein